MDSEEILEEAKKHLDDFKIDNYDELKSAIESKKLQKELEGLKYQRIIGIVTAMTALVSILLLIWQSNTSNQLNHKEILEMKIDLEKQRLEDTEKEVKKAGIKAGNLKKQSDSLEEKILGLTADVKLEIDKNKLLKEGILILKNKKSSLKDEVQYLESQRISFGNTEINDLQNQLSNLDLDKKKLTDEKNKLIDKKNELEVDLNENKLKVNQLNSRVSFLEEFQSNSGLVNTKKIEFSQKRGEKVSNNI